MTVIRSVASRLLLLVASLALALLIGEAVLRVFKPQPIGFDIEAIWEPAQGIGRRAKPNVDVQVNTGERNARFVTDVAGHRVSPSPKPPGQFRVLAVGDSMLQAIQVDYEQTMTALLERALTAALGRNVDIVNAGMAGWDPNQYLIAARSELQRSRYDLMLVFVYLENDIVGRRVASFPPAMGLVAPVLRPFEERPALTFEKAMDRARAWLRRHSHLFVYGDNLTRLLAVRSGTREHLLTNALRAHASAPVWSVTADILADISVAAEGTRTPVQYVLLPSIHSIDPQSLSKLEWAFGIAHADVDVAQPAQRMTAELSARGLQVVDATPALKKAFDAGERELYGRVDLHFALAGHRIMAGFLEPILRDRLTAAAPR